MKFSERFSLSLPLIPKNVSVINVAAPVPKIGSPVRTPAEAAIKTLDNVVALSGKISLSLFLLDFINYLKFWLF